jgi:hypothetical protein
MGPGTGVISPAAVPPNPQQFDPIGATGDALGFLLDAVMRATTGGTERENLVRGQAHPAFGRLGGLQTADIGSQEGHALASYEAAKRFGPFQALIGGALVEPLEKAFGTHAAGLTPDTGLDMLANLAGISRLYSPRLSDFIIDQTLQRWGNPAREHISFPDKRKKK